MKANSNLAILDLLARRGSGFDIVSGGELERVIAAGGDPAKTVFSGVGKSALEMEGALAAGIRCFNVESPAELEVLNAIAGRLGKRAPISIRVNPDVDPKTHPYIATGLKESKFGVAYNEAPALYRHAAGLAHVDVQGIDCHIGSQITDLAVYVETARKMFALVDALEAQGVALRHIDLGGGLGIRYEDEVTIDPGAYALAVRSSWGSAPRDLVRAGAVSDRRSRPAAHARRVPQDRREQGFRGRRCRDERPPATRVVCRLASDRGGTPRARASRAAGRSSDPCARAAISLRTTATSLSRPAICSRCAPPAHTGS
jgi:hypothetical protein